MASGIVESSQSGSEQQPQKPQPVARQQLVQRLLAASANLPNFIHEIIMMQATVVAGTEAAAFLIEPVPQQEGSPPTASLKAVAHIREDNSDQETRTAALQAFQEIIKPCIEQGKDGAIHIEGTTDGSESQFCLVTLLRSEGNVVAASAVITRARDVERARKLLQPLQLVAGYFELYTLRRRDEQSRSIAQSHQHVLQLATAVGTAEGFESAAMNLCNELASRTGAARVSLGWLKGETVKLKAISHTEQFDKKQELSVQLVKVMEECLDNDEIVQFEPGGTSTNTVTREAQSLSRTQGGETVLSLPLRRKGEIVGLVTLEFAPNSKIGQQAATGLAVAVDLLAPQLYDRYQNDRWLITKAGLSIRDLGEKGMGKQYMLAKTIIAVVLLVLAFITLYKPMYHVKATFAFVPIVKQTFAAPFDGQLQEVLVRPGDVVKEGQPLLRFRTDELEKKWIAKDAEAKQAHLESMRYAADDTKTAEAAIAEKKSEAARAEADLIQYQIDLATIKAPYDGEILNGDLVDKRGAVLKQGEELMVMAKQESLEVEIKVPQNDIQDVHVGATGWIAAESRPWEKFPIKVRNVVPLSEISESKSIFKVYATLDQTSGQWHPGELGEARIEVGNRSVAWIWTHRFIDFLRLKLWHVPFG
jgi:hypothetical protein